MSPCLPGEGEEEPWPSAHPSPLPWLGPSTTVQSREPRVGAAAGRGGRRGWRSREGAVEARHGETSAEAPGAEKGGGRGAGRLLQGRLSEE